MKLLDWVSKWFKKPQQVIVLQSRKTKVHLTRDKVRDIEQTLAVYPNADYTSLAKQYNVAQSTISRIRLGQHRYTSVSYKEKISAREN